MERTHQLFEHGVDLIIGHHPHIVGPVDWYETKDGRRCVAYYSLGSLTAYALAFAHQRLSLIAKTVLEAGVDESGATVVRPKRIIITPAFHSLAKQGGNRVNRVLAINKGMKQIKAGALPALYTKSDVRHVSHLHDFYRDLLTVEGIEYR